MLGSRYLISSQKKKWSIEMSVVSPVYSLSGTLSSDVELYVLFQT